MEICLRSAACLPAAAQRSSCSVVGSPEQFAAVKTSLCADDDLRQVLRVERVKLGGAYPSDSGLSSLIHIDRCCQPTCPYKGAPHAHNNVYVRYRPASATAFATCRLRCYDEACQAKLTKDKAAAFDWAVSFATDASGAVSASLRRVSGFAVRIDDNTAINAAADLIHSSTLHSRRDVIPWAEVYNAPQMRPYPLDKWLVIACAGMGVGEDQRCTRVLGVPEPAASFRARILALQRCGSTRYRL